MGFDSSEETCSDDYSYIQNQITRPQSFTTNKTIVETASISQEDNDRLLEKEQADTELYVLPDDESEWTKLFDVLRLRLVTTELSEQEKYEGERLLPYQDVISYLPPTGQVAIFQQLCLLTNATIERTD